MNVSETLQILQALKACGASHFKSQDFEISIRLPASIEQLPAPASVVAPAQAQPLSQPTENKEATEKLQSLIKTLSLPPEQLVDVIFPSGAGG
jgi:hypothetical protein